MMKARKAPETAAPPGPVEAVGSERSGRAPYVAPRVERLGAWTALTLQQSVPIFP
ncbi:MAG TPA: hypothetical protein VF188_07960 [Longimicrobiales bacterium]